LWGFALGQPQAARLSGGTALPAGSIKAAPRRGVKFPARLASPRRRAEKKAARSGSARTNLLAARVGSDLVRVGARVGGRVAGAVAGGVIGRRHQRFVQVGAGIAQRPQRLPQRRRLAYARRNPGLSLHYKAHALTARPISRRDRVAREQVAPGPPADTRDGRQTVTTVS